MGMFNFDLYSFKGGIFDFKVDRRVLVASSVLLEFPIDLDLKLFYETIDDPD